LIGLNPTFESVNQKNKDSGAPTAYNDIDAAPSMTTSAKSAEWVSRNYLSGHGTIGEISGTTIGQKINAEVRDDTDRQVPCQKSIDKGRYMVPHELGLYGYNRTRLGPDLPGEIGNYESVSDDELTINEDLFGRAKVDNNGNLLGGRRYRCRAFTVLSRGTRLYMLSAELAGFLGYSDPFQLFRKHNGLYKVVANDDEKSDLISRKIIPDNYKGRPIYLVTARSIFREFGAQIIVGGRRVIDDFWETRERQRGAKEGELAVPENQLLGHGQEYDSGASRMYKEPNPRRKKKNRTTITVQSPLFESVSFKGKSNSRQVNYGDDTERYVEEENASENSFSLADPPHPVSEVGCPSAEGHTLARKCGVILEGNGPATSPNTEIDSSEPFNGINQTDSFDSLFKGIVQRSGSRYAGYGSGSGDATDGMTRLKANRARLAREFEWAELWGYDFFYRK
jgi:hypothetical protein